MLRRPARRKKRRKTFLGIDRASSNVNDPAAQFWMVLPRRISMRPVKTCYVAAGLAVLTASTGAMAQSYYDDQTCRQYAGQQVAALQGQANAQAFGSTLLGAGIGAASGAVLGGATGVANAQNASAYAPQQYNAFYSQCMAARTPPPPSYYPPTPAYAPSPGYAPRSSGSANDLNRQ